MLRYGSVCSGIESASVAWEPLGMSAAWFSEIEPFPCSVLAHHWPHVANLGDMTQLPALMRMGLIEAPDVLVGGTPCQAFSVAGKRDSLDDERGQLTLTYVGLLNAIDEQRVGNECIAVWENVPGVLNTKDNAFGCFLGELSGSGCELQPSGKKWGNAGCVFGPQRAVAWRVIDAQYFGVAQRRRRVFVVASARDGFDSTKILFESEGVRRDIAPSRKAREEVTGNVGKGSHWDNPSNPHPTLNQSNNVGGIGSSNQEVFSQRGAGIVGQPYQDVSHCLNAGGMGRQDYESESFVVHGTENAVFGIPGNWIGRKPENGGNATEPMNNISPCQTVTDRHAVAYVGTVRRLTPTECERLQGFPDGHTNVPHNGKPAADGPRYKSIGNSKAVPCIQWIGARLITYQMGLL